MCLAKLDYQPEDMTSLESFTAHSGLNIPAFMIDIGKLTIEGLCLVLGDFDCRQTISFFPTDNFSVISTLPSDFVEISISSEIVFIVQPTIRQSSPIYYQ